MLIKYTGHACFKIRDNETGYSVVIDPYAPGSIPGMRDVVDSASEVLCSHEHSDHNSRDSVRLFQAESEPYEIRYIDTWHDAEKGAKRGANRIHIITDRKTGERLVHYGDIGEDIEELLTPENMELLENADAALIPVGGVYTYDAAQAIELIRRTHPGIAVPMHYRSESAGFGLDNIGSLENFMAMAHKAGFKVKVSDVWFYDTQENNIGECVLAIRPENMRY